MESLANTLAELKMRVDDGVNVSCESVQEKFNDAMARVTQVEEELLEQLDSDMYPGWTPIMFACTLLQDGWITRILTMAEHAEAECPNLRKRMLALRNEDGHNALILLFEAEQVEAQTIADEEDTDVKIDKTKLRKLVMNGASPTDGEGGPSAKMFAAELGEPNVFKGMKCSSPKSRTKKKRSSQGKSNRKK
jgi:hypothetical protein